VINLIRLEEKQVKLMELLLKELKEEHKIISILPIMLGIGYYPWLIRMNSKISEVRLCHLLIIRDMLK